MAGKLRNQYILKLIVFASGFYIFAFYHIDILRESKAINILSNISHAIMAIDVCLLHSVLFLHQLIFILLGFYFIRVFLLWYVVSIFVYLHILVTCRRTAVTWALKVSAGALNVILYTPRLSHTRIFNRLADS